MAEPSPAEQRARMVEQQLAARGIRDPRVLAAFLAVPRERFVPEEALAMAYLDRPLPIGAGQTISQPYIVAVTIEAMQLGGGERVLEIGAGSGYAAAVVSHVAREVFTVERIPALAELAHQRLRHLGFRNVHVRCGDGTLGWPEHAPYDAIAVAAGGPAPPRALLRQLRIGGRLVIPIGKDDASQVLVRIVRVGDDQFREEPIVRVRFVPLIGEQGWAEEGRRGAMPAVARAEDQRAAARHAAAQHELGIPPAEVAAEQGDGGLAAGRRGEGGEAAEGSEGAERPDSGLSARARELARKALPSRR